MGDGVISHMCVERTKGEEYRAVEAAGGMPL